MILKTSLLTSATAIAIAAAVPAIAQSSNNASGSSSSSSSSSGQVTPLSDFDMTQIEGAWSADAMRDATVYGQDGDTVGYVQEIVINPDNSVRRIVIETDNWLDIGDRVISVPWNNVDLTPQTDGISVNIDETNINDFSIFGDDESANVDQRAFPASEILGETVTLQDGTNYGAVSDMIFSQDGTLSSVVISPDVSFGDDSYGGGTYAFPFYGYGYGNDPYADGYTLPYAEQQVLDHGSFDMSMLNDQI